MFKNYTFDSSSPINRYSFEIFDIDIAVINSIRRVILSDIEIPGMIGEGNDVSINIIANNGPLHNEYLIHRIGLIPICLKESEIDSYEDNSIELELNMENTGNNTINVTTENITATRNGINIDKKELSSIFYPNKVSNDYILISRLRNGEKLHFKGKVVKKNGKYNASFNPVCLANFSYMIDKTKINKDTNILDKERQYFTNEYGDANYVKFELEPINKYLTPKYLINKAIEVIIEKLNNLIKEIKKENIEIKKYLDKDNKNEFNINNENDTVGNLVQSYIHNKFIRKKEKFKENTECLYCGYICPHPLKDLLIIRITLNEEKDKKVFANFLEYNLLGLIDNLHSIKSEWNLFMNKD